MDSLTHIVLGAAVGEASLGKKIGNKAVLIGAIAGSSPDFDVFFTSLFDPVKALFVHRGFSHSIFLMVITSFLIAWILKRINTKKEILYSDWFKLIFLSILSHIFIDCFNTYGTGIFEPFSSIRIAYDSIGIIDLFLTIPLLILTVWITLLIKDNRLRRYLAYSAITFTSVYILFTVYNKMEVERLVKHQISTQKIDFLSFRTSPSPLSNFLWMAAIEQKDGFLTGYYSIFDKDDQIKLTYTSKQHDQLGKFKDDESVKGLIRFTKNYYVVEKVDGSSLWLYDLRYGTLGINDPKPWVFSFQITEKDGITEVSRSHPDRKITKETFKDYWSRVF